MISNDACAKKRPDMVRLTTGIPGLDDMIEGGFPFPSVMLLAGSAGTGKTTFAMRYLCEGAKQGEQGLYFTTLSEPTQWMLRFATQFDFMDPAYFNDSIVYCDLGDKLRNMDQEALLNMMEEKIAEVMPQRIVIDPITVIGNMIQGDYRQFLFDLTNRLKNWNATTLMTGEVKPGELYPPEVAYAADGIILLLLSEEMGARRKYLEVLKMRGTNHQSGKQSIDISRKDGIVVLKARF
jgi:circadian clock protein KaiC